MPAAERITDRRNRRAYTTLYFIRARRPRGGERDLDDNGGSWRRRRFKENRNQSRPRSYRADSGTDAPGVVMTTVPRLVAAGHSASSASSEPLRSTTTAAYHPDATPRVRAHTALQTALRSPLYGAHATYTSPSPSPPPVVVPQQYTRRTRATHYATRSSLAVPFVVLALLSLTRSLSRPLSAPKLYVSSRPA